eukprot:s7776_g3.t1
MSDGLLARGCTRIPAGLAKDSSLFSAFCHALATSWQTRRKERRKELLSRCARHVFFKHRISRESARCRQARPVSKVVGLLQGVGKKLKMSEDVTVSIAPVGVAKGPRSVPSVMVYLSLLEILLHGYAYVGNFVDHTSNNLYCSLDCIREYLAFVKSKVAPLPGGMHSLSDLRRADEDSRTLWAEQMRSGKTFDEAVQASEAKVAALWLFASRTDVGAASAVVVEEDEDARPTKRPKGDPNIGVAAPPPPPAVANVDAEGPRANQSADFSMRESATGRNASMVACMCATS